MSDVSGKEPIDNVRLRHRPNAPLKRTANMHKAGKPTRYAAQPYSELYPPRAMPTPRTANAHRDATIPPLRTRQRP